VDADFKAFRQKLLERVDIVDLIGRHVALKRAGKDYKACCPFHNEKTPSFTVSPSGQFYHCFGCQAHGNAIDFLMQHAGLGFIEAVEELAREVGLEVPRPAGAQAQAKQGEKAAQRSLTETMALAARFYRRCLKTAPAAIDYLKRRGLSGEIAARFGLGYAPDDWQALAAVFPNYDAAALVECGLVIDHESGRRYDRFRDRIMFPILDGRSQVIGFGGRILGAGEPKYLNSPETPLFDKGRELYGLPQARAALRREDAVLVVEGYMDVVALAQHGIKHVVATLGTATTPAQAQKLLRLAGQVIFCFDGDAAGRKAAWRALEACLEFLGDDQSVGFLFLPAEHDPDSFVRAEGADALRALIAQPVPLSEFLLRGLKQKVGKQVGLDTAEGRAQLLHAAKPLLQRLAAPLLRSQIVRALAHVVALAPAEVESQCQLAPQARRRPPPPLRTRSLAISPQRPLLEAVLRQPQRAARLPIDLIDTTGEDGRLLQAIHDAIVHGDLAAGNSAALLEHFRGSEHEAALGAMLAMLSEEEVDAAEEEQVFIDALARLHQAALKAEIDALTAKARRTALSEEELQRYRRLLQLRAGTARPV